MMDFLRVLNEGRMTIGLFAILALFASMDPVLVRATMMVVLLLAAGSFGTSWYRDFIYPWLNNLDKEGMNDAEASSELEPGVRAASGGSDGGEGR